MKLYKKNLCFILTILLMLSLQSNAFLSVSAEEPETDETEYVPPEEYDYYLDLEEEEAAPIVDTSSSSGRSARKAPLTASYIPDWENEFPVVRNQGSYGTCWAFSSIFNAESWMIGQGLADTSVDYSELALAYSTYHPAADPLGNINDTISLSGSSLGYLLVGGNPMFAAHTLFCGNGVVDESFVPYHQASTVGSQGLSDDLKLQDTLHIRSLTIMNPKENPDIVKRTILSNGSVSASIYATNQAAYFNSKTYAYYYSKEISGTNHAISLIGWDDTYSKENFSTEPEGDGAWLVRNSWGKNGYSYNGYYWLSYYDKSLSSSAYGMTFTTADDYDHNYQYDGSIFSASMPSAYSYGANVFTVPENIQYEEKLTHISVGLNCTNTTAEVKIYTDLTDLTNPESGTLQESAITTASFLTAGIYTIDLNEPVYLSAGQTFSVVINVTTEDSYAFHLERNSQLSSDSITITATTGAQNQKSFVRTESGNWQTSNGASSNPDRYGELRIKAYTSDVPNPIVRAAGSSRYETSYEAARTLLRESGKDSFDTVVIASGANFPDALSGTYLAAVADAPVILTADNRKEELQSVLVELLSPGGKVYLLGGTGVISEGVMNTLSDSGYTVERLGGINRYETNLRILEEAEEYEDANAILICSGTGFADSLSASAVGRPIFLVGSQLTEEQKAYLTEQTYNEATIVGGTGAVNEAIEQALSSYVPVEQTVRIGGSNRYDTSVKLASYFFGNTQNSFDQAVFVYGENFPDGLSAGPLAYEKQIPLLLCSQNEAHYTLIGQYLSQAGPIKQAYVLGGPTLLSDELIKAQGNLE